MRVDYERPDDFWSGDRGAGLIRPAESRSFRGVDTLRVYAGPSTRMPPIAYLLFDERGSGPWRHAIVARDSIRPRFVEFGYEILGFPIDAPPAGGWARAVLGLDTRGRRRFGWVQVDTATMDVVIWRERLRESGVFFLPPNRPEFFDGPDARRVRIPLRSGDNEPYVMEPDSVVGAWMRVRVMQPTACSDSGPKFIGTAWIRYLAAGGRPRVFYWTRGC